MNTAEKRFYKQSRVQAPNESLLKAGISELILPSWEQASFELLLPMVSHLSHQAGERWLTWLGKTNLSKGIGLKHELNRKNIRTIASANDEETLWMTWDALNNGTSAFVVASFELSSTVTQKERAQLEQACANGQCRALIIKSV